MQLAQLIIHNFLSFVFIISLIVFIHEFGHFFVARLCGVQVDEFSLGFGYEILGFKDKKGTRWKICLLPFGGYVKMYGDRNAASVPDSELINNMTEVEKKKSFIEKNVYQRFAIVAAGPIANFLLTIIIFTFLFRVNGLNTTLPIIDEVMIGSAAIEVGLQKGDEILAINDKKISDFNEIREIVSATKDSELLLKVKRSEENFEVKITPKIQIKKDFFGDEIKVGMLGITASTTINQKLNLLQSFTKANEETYHISLAIFKALGELITGVRSIDELGGPIKIAKYSGKTVDMGAMVVIWFMAMISLNLGVMNLLPVPMLDGGHLFFYIIEAMKGKALSQKTQKIAFRIGFSLIVMLMIFTTFNDIKNLFK
jgi:regulator of sigma E protease